MEPSSIEKIVEIDAHIGCAMSGLIADAKTLIDKARVETQNHWFTYNETMTVESVTQAVSNLALQFGEEDADPGAMSRPFGVALLFGELMKKDPSCFTWTHLEPLYSVMLEQLALPQRGPRAPCRKFTTSQ